MNTKGAHIFSAGFEPPQFEAQNFESLTPEAIDLEQPTVANGFKKNTTPSAFAVLPKLEENHSRMMQAIDSFLEKAKKMEGILPSQIDASFEYAAQKLSDAATPTGPSMSQPQVAQKNRFGKP